MADYCTWEMFEYALDSLVRQIKSSNINFDGVYGIPRGGLPIAVALSHRLKLPFIESKEKITYKTLIVDDITDGGNTLEEYRDYKIVTLYTTKHSKVQPDFFVFLKHDEWVIFPWEVDED